MGIRTSQNKEILLDREKIEQRVSELADEISADYENGTLLMVGVLKGAFVFLADLIRRLSIPCEVDFIRLASYGTGTVSSGNVDLVKDLEMSIQGRDVLIVEDIIDTGLTIVKLMAILRQRKPLSIRVCALLDKSERRKESFVADYVGFAIEDNFVVGYGLDCSEKDRYWPDIYVIRE
ncbi:MAG: hypoxanthine phosphoribosyltransferase [Syntrophales bacterium]|jgi:hypoxanthine phosphoribosyltransferase